MNEAGQVRKLPIDDVLPNRFQPRIKFSESEVLALADSIKNHGVIQPILVRPIGDKFEIIAGERRYKASVMAGLKEIPAIVRQLDDKQSAELALIENVQRKDLTPIEEALSYKKILDMGYLTQEQLALKLGKKQSTIANKLRLLNLDEDVQNALLYEKISERHARSLLKLDKEDQKEMLKRIINERLTVRQTDLEIQKLLAEKEKENQNQQTDILNEDIEILDFPEEETVKSMEDNTMNQTAQYNIPNNTIQNDVPETVVTNQSAPMTQQPITPELTTPMQSGVTVNPGFMDVDKIVETAQDINRPTQKDKKTIEDLLKPDEQMLKMEAEEKKEQEKKDESEQLLKPGKFFNLADLEEAEEDNKQSGFIENIDQAQANMDFGVKPTPAPTNGFDFDKFFNPNEFEKTLEPTENVTTTDVPNTMQTVESSQPQQEEVSTPAPVENQPDVPPVQQEPEIPTAINQNMESDTVMMQTSPETVSNIMDEPMSNVESEPMIQMPEPESTVASQEPEEVLSTPAILQAEESVVAPTMPVEPEIQPEVSQPTIPAMSEEEFLKTIPDSNLPLSSLNSTVKEEVKEPEIHQEDLEPQYDFTNLSNIMSDVEMSQPTKQEEVPVLKETEPMKEEMNAEPLLEPEISPVEPIITDQTNSFLFEPDESEEAMTTVIPDTSVATPSSSPVELVVPSNDSLNVEETPEPVKVFDVQKVSLEAKNFAQELQNKGYQVRIEEYDFEDLYQVVFKVRKDI